MNRFNRIALCLLLPLGFVAGCESAGSHEPDSGGSDTAAGSSSVHWVTNASFSPTKLPKIVVLVEDKVRHRPHDDGVISGIEDEFMQSLTSKGYDVPSRGDLKAVLSETAFQQNSGLTEADAAQIGRQLNAPAILIVSITANSIERKEETEVDPLGGGPLFKKKMVRYAHAGIGARLIEVETSKYLCGAKELRTVKVDDENDGSDALGSVAQAVAASFPQRQEAAAMR